jgi:hypothetical protein
MKISYIFYLSTLAVLVANFCVNLSSTKCNNLVLRNIALMQASAVEMICANTNTELCVINTASGGGPVGIAHGPGLVYP